jgi:putative transposase
LLCAKSFLTHNSTPYQIVFKSLTFGLLFGGRVRRMIKDVFPEYGISEATYYNWKSRYGGMMASDVKKLKEFEDENRRQKRMYADLSLQNEALKDVIEKTLRSAGKRELDDYTKEEHGLSIRKA